MIMKSVKLCSFQLHSNYSNLCFYSLTRSPPDKRKYLYTYCFICCNYTTIFNYAIFIFTFCFIGYIIYLEYFHLEIFHFYNLIEAIIKQKIKN